MEVRLYKAADGRKEHIGVLKAYTDGAVTIESAGVEKTFAPEQIAQVRLRIV